MNDNMMSLDDHIKRDKKLGRVRGQGAARGAPLPGRGRGGKNNQQANRVQPRMRANPNRIQKQQPMRQQGRQQQPAMMNNQNQALNKNQLRKQRRNQRLMGDSNTAPKANAQFTQGAGQRRQLMQDLRQNKRQRGRRANLVSNAQN